MLERPFGLAARVLGQYNGSVSLPVLAVRIRFGEHGERAEAVRELASAVEEEGADALFVNGERAADGANDPFVILGAAAASTSHVGLGCVATPIGERPPSVLAKTLASLDMVSGGRAIACLSTQSTPATSPKILVEAVAVIRAMLDSPAPSFHGEHFEIAEAWNEPRMHRRERMPLGIVFATTAPDDQVKASQETLTTSFWENVDFVVSDARQNSGIRGTPSLALIDGTSGAEIEHATKSVLGAQHAGLILDFPEVPETAALRRAVATVRSVSGR
ncbi:MAG: LLM class flavin-dependent oxidoreductase [Acidimicrobiales bacterium]